MARWIRIVVMSTYSRRQLRPDISFHHMHQCCGHIYKRASQLARQLRRNKDPWMPPHSLWRIGQGVIGREPPFFRLYPASNKFLLLHYKKKDICLKCFPCSECRYFELELAIKTSTSLKQEIMTPVPYIILVQM
jgi:hypothetical protein